jgi:conjugative transfer region protein TrbK
VTEPHGKKAAGRFAGVGWRSAVIAGAAAATGIVALFALNDPGPQAARYAVGESQDGPTIAEQDPLRTELTRCRSIAATADDAACRAAWEVNRRRFMGESRSFIAPGDPPAESSPVPASAMPPADGKATER